MDVPCPSIFIAFYILSTLCIALGTLTNTSQIVYVAHYIDRLLSTPFRNCYYDPQQLWQNLVKTILHINIQSIYYLAGKDRYGVHY